MPSGCMNRTYTVAVNSILLNEMNWFFPRVCDILLNNLCRIVSICLVLQTS